MHNREMMLVDILTPLSLYFPQAGYSAAHLAALADDWCEDLAEYSADVLVEAVKNLRRQEHFFPTLARMIDYAGEVMARRRATMRELPMPPMTPDKMTRNAQLAWLLHRQLNGDENAGKEFARILSQPEGVRA